MSNTPVKRTEHKKLIIFIKQNNNDKTIIKSQDQEIAPHSITFY